MQQIKTGNASSGYTSRFATLRERLVAAAKWWAEHQAWPATDEIRIDRSRSTCD